MAHVDEATSILVDFNDLDEYHHLSIPLVNNRPLMVDCKVTLHDHDGNQATATVLTITAGIALVLVDLASFRAV